MFYRENHQFKSSYVDDMQIFPIRQDRIAVLAMVGAAFLVVPFLFSDYAFRALIIPFLILSLAAIGLNLLVGYCGQISLGSGAFMAVGAYAAYNVYMRLDGVGLIPAMLAGGAFAALAGILFGIPSLRIRGLYLAVATLAAQFFSDWLFTRVAWFTLGNASGNASVPALSVFGVDLNSPVRRYLFCLTVLVLFALAARNLVRGHIGRSWMAMRDMDVAAAVIGIQPMRAKLSAFAVSSFFIGVAGALWAFVHLGSWEPAAFDVHRSLGLLFMIIIGGLGSILGSLFGAAFIVLLPIGLNQIPAMFGMPISVATAAHLESMIFGALIIFFLIAEPHGLARLWAIGKEKARLWPFPH